MRRRALTSLLTATMIITLGACTTATPYQPYRPEAAGGVHGGYSEQRIAADHYRVRFHGNSLTARDRVEGYMLYRAAELALQNDYDWFLIVDRQMEHDVETYVRPDPFYRPWYGNDYGYWRPSWRYYRPEYGWQGWYPGSGPFWNDRPDITRVEAFEATAEILLRKGPPPVSEPRAVDARKVIRELGPEVERPRG